MMLIVNITLILAFSRACSSLFHRTKPAGIKVIFGSTGAHTDSACSTWEGAHWVSGSVMLLLTRRLCTEARLTLGERPGV
jgi:hypothetical protein